MSKTPRCLRPVSDDCRLSQWDADDTAGMTREAAEAEYAALQIRLRGLQERLYAEAKQSVLVILQAMDTGGKDGTTKKVMDAVNPQGVAIASFKAPTAEELAHDFLWRAHQKVPRKGEIGLFNRSHYEDVLVVRVKEFVPEAVWRKRYDQINEFEQLLTQTGTTIVKVFLHISRAEQKRRLVERINDPQKRWKFNPGDLVERGNWDKYMAAYEDVFKFCSPKSAPWHIVPANQKWFRNYVVTKLLVDTLEQMNPKFPKITLENIEIPD